MNRQTLTNKRIPTLVGMLILLGGFLAGIIAVNQRQGLGAKAGPTDIPKNVRITNLGTNTFTISWTTDTPVTGFVKYSENPSKITSPAGDIRDQISGTAQAYTNHYVNITNLSENKTYYFLIGSGPQTYDDNGKPFQVSTTNQVISPPEDVINGKVLSAEMTPVSGAIVYLDIEGGQTVSTVTKTDGTWRLNLAMTRTKDGSILTYDNNALISIFVQASSGTATATTNTSKTKPVEDIILGKNQSFVENLPTIPVNDLSTDTSGEGFSSLANQPGPTVEIQTSPEATGSVQILNPALDGEMISTDQPEIKGKAIPGTDIKITVHSAVAQEQLIKADVDGTWSWTPPINLEPGIHTLEITYVDEFGVSQTINRTFTVLAAESTTGLPAFTATPSATTTLSPTATPTPTPTVIITPTILVTPTPTPTEIVVTPTLEPLFPTPTEIMAEMPATDSGTLESTGTMENTLVILAIGIVFLFGGNVYKKKFKQSFFD